MAPKGWEKVKIKTNEGLVEGIAPVIISASRATDLPALYADWFRNRLTAGYVKWINPFNQKQQYVSFEKARVVVFWTKNPRPFLPVLEQLEKRHINYYLNFTVNDYEAEGYEPGIPPLQERIETFQALAERIGLEKVIWRFDPLLLTESLGVEGLLEKLRFVGDKLQKFTDKLVVSFADIAGYSRVRNNLKRSGINYREFDGQTMLEMAKGIADLNRDWGLTLATCSEGIELSGLGFRKNRCVDGELMLNLFREDQDLMEFLGYCIPGRSKDQLMAGLKDKGQRGNCGCIVSKDIGQYNTCNHGCVYCYANNSPKVGEQNYLKYSRSGKDGEGIL